MVQIREQKDLSKLEGAEALEKEQRWPSRAACAMVGTDDQDNLLEALEELPHKQTVIDLQAKGEKLQMEVNRLKKKLEDEKETNVVAATKLSDSLDLIFKMEGYV